MTIQQAHEHQNIQKHGGYRQWIEALITMRRPGFKVNWAPTGGFIMPEIIRGNWVAGCPYCTGYIMIDLGEPYFCPDCLMQGNEFHPRPTSIPDDRETIEQLLVQRVDPTTRNWRDGETIEQLREENASHGVS